MTMNADVKAKWVAALRSGEYKQTRGVLADKQGFCCLGVLCEIAVRGGAIDDYDGDDSVPSFAVQDWAGLEHRNPSVFFDNFSTNLADVNDGHLQTFAVIADVIEEQL
jgi:hypothetical protein